MFKENAIGPRRLILENTHCDTQDRRKTKLPLLLLEKNLMMLGEIGPPL